MKRPPDLPCVGASTDGSVQWISLERPPTSTSAGRHGAPEYVDEEDDLDDIASENIEVGPPPGAELRGVGEPPVVGGLPRAPTVHHVSLDRPTAAPVAPPAPRPSPGDDFELARIELARLLATPTPIAMRSPLLDGIKTDPAIRAFVARTMGVSPDELLRAAREGERGTMTLDELEQGRRE